MSIIEQLFVDAFFSAISRDRVCRDLQPSEACTVAVSALLSAAGHSFRYYLLYVANIDIATSTFLAALLIGVMSFGFAMLIRCPNEVFTFPSLLPMIPGMYAYRMFLSLAQFIRSSDSSTHLELISNIFYNGTTAILFLIALVVGVSICYGVPQ